MNREYFIIIIGSPLISSKLIFTCYMLARRYIYFEICSEFICKYASQLIDTCVYNMPYATHTKVRHNHKIQLANLQIIIYP